MTCGFCNSGEDLAPYVVVASPTDTSVSTCRTCRDQLESKTLDEAHWKCLTESMWSETPAIQVMAHRVLTGLSSQAWAQEALDMLYLDEDLMAWSQADSFEAEDNLPTLDSNGTALQAGDNVTLIKDLPVKGAGFTAKRGTVVRGISLTDNPLHIEGRVEGQRIVLVAAFLKRS